MLFAFVLIVIVAASVLFHFVSPWWTTPLASNWREMDDTLTITLVITGVFFVIINLFVAYTLLRYRHRDGHRAAYAPDNRKLEYWLIGITAQPHLMASVGTGKDEHACRVGFMYGNFTKRVCTIGWAMVGLMVAAMIASPARGR